MFQIILCFQNINIYFLKLAEKIFSFKFLRTAFIFLKNGYVKDSNFPSNLSTALSLHFTQRTPAFTGIQVVFKIFKHRALLKSKV